MLWNIRTTCCHANRLKRIWSSDTYFNGPQYGRLHSQVAVSTQDDSSVEIVNIHGNGFRLVNLIRFFPKIFSQEAVSKIRGQPFLLFDS